MEEIPVPQPGPGEALVKVEAVGICASDLKCYAGAAKFWGDANRPAWVDAGCVPGHEFTGTVVQLDDQAREHWKIDTDDRVVAEQIVPCWNCRFCLTGKYWMCAVHDIYGFRQRTPGAMAEYIRFPAGALNHKVPAGLPAHHAAFIEPLACSIHAVERGNIEFGDVVVIAGAGPLGLGMIAAARMKSPRLLVAVDLNDARLEMAKRCGADIGINPTKVDAIDEVRKLTDGYGCDVYIEATGHPQAVIDGLQMIRKLGTFVEFSVMREPVTVDWTIIGDTKELDIHGAHLSPHTYPVAIRMLEQRLLPIEEIVTQRMPLADFQKGIDLVASGATSIKVTLEP
jgi:threonine dehydrogenase-like Zn-dependent dehydrogenase